jgi:excisionase family DNA binding protein
MMSQSAKGSALTMAEGGGHGLEWLTLREASAILGVHFTTLRSWADQGDIRVFRTPGGHRRFSKADLRRFLEERASHTKLADADLLVEAALGRVRQQMAKIPIEHSAWRQESDESVRQMNQERGRRLFALAVNFIIKPSQRAEILIDGRVLGHEYGQYAVRKGIGLAETGRAVQFFRRQLLDVVRRDDTLDAEDMHIRQLLDQFLDEILYAVLEGYGVGQASRPAPNLVDHTPDEP